MRALGSGVRTGGGAAYLQTFQLPFSSSGIACHYLCPRFFGSGITPKIMLPM
jgi:hypothetical protein